jgi:hypothetical protein
MLSDKERNEKIAREERAQDGNGQEGKRALTKAG